MSKDHELLLRHKVQVQFRIPVVQFEKQMSQFESIFYTQFGEF